MSEFKIEGPGFYRQRNGERAEVFAFRGKWAYGMTSGMIPYYWKMNGIALFGPGDNSFDLVSVWRHEPPEPWTPTCELRWRDKGELADPSVWMRTSGESRYGWILEQKWTRGDAFEWRPVEVVK